jgi:hypothetical protein
MGLGDEDAVRKVGVGRRKRLPHFSAPSGAGAFACQVGELVCLGDYA